VATIIALDMKCSYHRLLGFSMGHVDGFCPERIAWLRFTRKNEATGDHGQGHAWVSRRNDTRHHEAACEKSPCRQHRELLSFCPYEADEDDAEFNLMQVHAIAVLPWRDDEGDTVDAL
jgi:hypothetical protein